MHVSQQLQKWEPAIILSSTMAQIFLCLTLSESYTKILTYKLVKLKDTKKPLEVIYFEVGSNFKGIKSDLLYKSQHKTLSINS